MGIVPLSLQTLLRHIHHVGGLKDCRLMELGDQQMMCHPTVTEGSAAKEWFLLNGVKQHVSVDTNGLLGAMPLDLSLPIERPEFDGAFDVVTDFGTSEHVGESLAALYNCRANCHRWCRPGGLMVFINPKHGHWPKHGYHYFTMSHYHLLADICGYQVLEVSEHPSCGNTIDGWQVHAAFLKRTPEQFIHLKDFKDICAGTVFRT